MKWENKEKIFENLIDRVDANAYKTDYKFDFVNKTLGSEKVTGLDAFIQKFIKVLLTDNTRVIHYGLAHLLPTSNNQSEFNKQCTDLSDAILNHRFSDSTPESPNGLGHTVRKIYSIDYDEKNQTYSFVVSVEGEFECPKITFPTLSAISK